jgi:RimJ/RimL family protein N-acetyltransferase
MARNTCDNASYTMEMMEVAFKGHFRSSNRIYRAIEDDGSDKYIIYRHVWSDVATHGFGVFGMLRLHSREAGYKAIDELVNSALLAVMVCLPHENDDRYNHKSMEMETPTEATFDVRRKSTPIGILILDKIQPNIMRRARIGIQIAVPHQNLGCGREALNWALDWCFRFADLHRVEIGTASYNERAVTLYKMGFRLEGNMKEALFMDRKWHDLLSFGMLAREWESLRSARMALDDLQRGFSFKRQETA